MKRNRRQHESSGLQPGRLVKRLAGRRVSILAVVLITGCALGLAARAYTRRSFEAVAPVRSTNSSNATATSQKPAPASSSIISRLRLQPEADGLRRRLGERFSSSGLEELVMFGTLTTKNNQQPVRINRMRDDEGEKVDIAISGEPLPLRWDSNEGARANGAVANSVQRSIIERLALDSPDQFIFAQLRGAAYNTVARNIRPAEAGDSDDYDGPIWDVVRVVESTSRSKNKPHSPWRLYYINSSTGLIDKILSQEDGENVIAQLSSWVNQGGELFPTRITWIRDKEVLMELNINNISLNAR